MQRIKICDNTMEIVLILVLSHLAVIVQSGRLDKLEIQMRSLDSKLDGYAFDILTLKTEVASTNTKLDTLIEMLNKSDTKSPDEDTTLVGGDSFLGQDSETDKRMLRLDEMQQSVEDEVVRVRRAFSNVKRDLFSQKLTNEQNFQTFAETLNETLASLDTKTEEKLTSVTDSVDAKVTDMLNRVSESVDINLAALNDSVHQTVETMEHRVTENTDKAMSLLNALTTKIRLWNETIYVTMDVVKTDLSKQVKQMSKDEQALLLDVKGELDNLKHAVQTNKQLADNSGAVITELTNTVNNNQDQVENMFNNLMQQNSRTNIRLENATYSKTHGEGRLEVFLDNAWGTVCDDNFVDIEANIACQMFGYNKGEAKGSAFYGRGTGLINMDNIDCNSGHSSIFSCQYTRKHDCGHHEDVGVKCTYQ